MRLAPETRVSGTSLQVLDALGRTVEGEYRVTRDNLLRVRALEQLSAQVLQASHQVETQTSEAYGQIETENVKARRAILKQKISPLVSVALYK